MYRPASRTARITLRRAVTATVSGILLTSTLVALTAHGPADAQQQTSAATASSAKAAKSKKKKVEPTGIITPGNFIGHGFDQCHTPDQKKMNAWLQSSPFLAVGVYISGDSRACRNQPNLTPRWVSTQLKRGWRLLPITLGPQASCQPRFPRYNDDETIIPQPGANGRYAKARKQANVEAQKAVAAATALGIAPGSTLYYDLEGFDLRNTHCRESALAFLSGWTWQIHKLGYKSGVYSSAGSGIKMLDDARVQRPKEVNLPDHLWIARWDGKANIETEKQYLRPDGWKPHSRIKQYQGGHNETWGGVTINIDRNFLNVGRGWYAEPEDHCNSTRINFQKYESLRAPAESYVPPAARVKALQCLLQEQEFYKGKINGRWTNKTVKAFQAWQTGRGIAVRENWSRKHWMMLLSVGEKPVLKFGSMGPAVRRLQRALNASGVANPLVVNGHFKTATWKSLKTWQAKVGVEVSGVAGNETWKAISSGKF